MDLELVQKAEALIQDAEIRGVAINEAEIEDRIPKAVNALMTEGEKHLAESKRAMAGDPAAPCREGEGGPWASNRSHAIAELRWALDLFDRAEKLLRRARQHGGRG